MSTYTAPSNDAQSELSATIALAIPVVFVQLGFMAMGVVDTLMVGRLSARVLAAVALGNLYFFNVSIFGQGTLMALDPLVAQAIGAERRRRRRRARFSAGLFIALGAERRDGAAARAGGAGAARCCISRRRSSPTPRAYVRISIVGVLPYFAFVVLRQSLQAMHRVAPIVVDDVRREPDERRSQLGVRVRTSRAARRSACRAARSRRRSAAGS